MVANVQSIKSTFEYLVQSLENRPIFSNAIAASPCRYYVAERMSVSKNDKCTNTFTGSRLLEFQVQMSNLTYLVLLTYPITQ